MTEQPAQRHPMTPRQLRAVIYRIAVIYLEVERGLRPPDQLAAFLSPAEYRRHRVTTRGARATARPVRPPDIGPARIDAATPDRVSASLLVQRDDNRWSALLIDLKRTGRGWQVDRLDRLERFVPREPRHVEIDESACDRRRRFVERERQTVDAVYRAVQRRYDSIPDKRTKPARALRPELNRWAERLASLDEELRVLPACKAVEHVRDTDRGGTASDGARAVDATDDAAVRTLDIETLIARYRKRWGLALDEPVLGIPVDEIQSVDRRELLVTIREAANHSVIDIPPGLRQAGMTTEL